MTRGALEGFVDAEEAGKFLALPRRRILELARAGKLPAHPIGDGWRRTWRFRLSEISDSVALTEKSRLASPARASMVRLKAGSGAIGTEG